MSANIKGSKGRVLIVDDDQISLSCLQLALEDEGYEVDTAQDVQPAIDAAVNCQPDVLVTDIALPNGSGMEIAERLHSLYALPAIALTGYDPEDLVRTHNVEFSGHLTKPIDHDKLFRMIERITAAKSRSL